ncbi:MAG TPA: hypothetical protein VGB17_01935 [Pyrinomonadaceae bacterium]
MKSNGHGLLNRVLMLALGLFLVLPGVTFAAQGRGKPTNIFVNGHDARDGRLDRADQRRRDDDDQWRRDRDRDRDRDGRRRNRRGGRSQDDYPDYGGSFQLRQTALNAGYNNGIEAGRKDRRKGNRYEFRDEGEYQKATKDYNSRYGDRELYRRYFRMAFENGYDAGYNGY